MSNPYTQLALLDLMYEMRRAATKCPDTLSMSGWATDPQVRAAHDRYSDYLRTTSPQNVIRLLDHVEKIEKERKEEGRVFNPRDVEELITQAFRLKPDDYVWPDEVSNDIDTAIEFTRHAASHPKVLRIPPPPVDHPSAHYTALMAAIVTGLVSNGVTLNEALDRASGTLNSKGIV